MYRTQRHTHTHTHARTYTTFTTWHRFSSARQGCKQGMGKTLVRGEEDYRCETPEKHPFADGLPIQLPWKMEKSVISHHSLEADLP